MKAIVIDHSGGPEALVYRDLPDPEQKAGHATVQVKALGLNHAESQMRKGEWDEYMPVTSLECVGLVTACPGGEFAVGDEGRRDHGRSRSVDPGELCRIHERTGIESLGHRKLLALGPTGRGSRNLCDSLVHRLRHPRREAWANFTFPWCHSARPRAISPSMLEPSSQPPRAGRNASHKSTPWVFIRSNAKAQTWYQKSQPQAQNMTQF